MGKLTGSKLGDMPPILAAADIGSNTVHLLVAEVTGRKLRRIINESEWLSLGERVSLDGCFSPKLIESLLTTLRKYKKMAQAAMAGDLTVFATEAMRRAANHDEVIAIIRQELGLNVELISGPREAALSFQGVQLDVARETPYLLTEVGGGSAQFAQVSRSEIAHSLSLPIGTGKLIASFGVTPNCERERVVAAKQYLRDQLRPAPSVFAGPELIASGGVARGIIRSLHPDGSPLIAGYEVEYMIETASRLTSLELTKRFLVKRKRAESLLAGSLVYQAILERFGMPQMLVSEFGVREGAILELAGVKL